MRLRIGLAGWNDPGPLAGGFWRFLAHRIAMAASRFAASRLAASRYPVRSRAIHMTALALVIIIACIAALVLGAAMTAA